MEAAWIWWILFALLLFGGEILTTGLFLLWIGIGALLGGGLALVGLPIQWQLLGFVICSGGLIASSRTLFQRMLGQRYTKPIPTNVDALINLTATVIKAIDNDKGGGLVKVGGEDWSALSADNHPIAKGRRVQILRVEGVKLVVVEQP